MPLLLLVIICAAGAATGQSLIVKELSIDSLGACQGISVQQNKIFLYGDREVGVIREYRLKNDTLIPTSTEIRLTVNDTDIINHPTGIAYRKGMPAFIGNSVRLNKEGTLWRALIYHVDWDGMQKNRILEGNLLKTIDDDACIQGVRPEYVRYHNKWWIATADYGNKGNEVRLYDPEALKNASKTSDAGVLYKKFNCSPWVQNLHFIPESGVLVLIQNQIEGRRWRLTFLNLEKSIVAGKQHVIKVLDTNRADELEGFAFIDKKGTAIAVTSSRRNNVNLLSIKK